MADRRKLLETLQDSSSDKTYAYTSKNTSKEEYIYIII
jgi:hypothetical protein